jgi:hypothetical protein
MFPATFVGGAIGAWRVERINTLAGEPLADVERLDVRAGLAPEAGVAPWVLRGVASHVRYVERREKTDLDAL